MATHCAVCNGKLLTPREQGNAAHNGKCVDVLMQYLFDVFTNMSSEQLHTALTDKSFVNGSDQETMRLVNELIDATVREEVQNMNAGTPVTH